MREGAVLTRGNTRGSSASRIRNEISLWQQHFRGRSHEESKLHLAFILLQKLKTRHPIHGLMWRTTDASIKLSGSLFSTPPGFFQACFYLFYLAYNKILPMWRQIHVHWLRDASTHREYSQTMPYSPTFENLIFLAYFFFCYYISLRSIHWLIPRLMTIWQHLFLRERLFPHQLIIICALWRLVWIITNLFIYQLKKDKCRTLF